MNNSGTFRGGEGLTELFPGVFHTLDFDNPDFHDGRFIHFDDTYAMAAELGYIDKVGGYAIKAIHNGTVEIGQHPLPGEPRPFVSIGSRLIDWQIAPRDHTPEGRTKRRRLFYANDRVATAFYDHLVPTWKTSTATMQFDVIEALLKARGVDRHSPKRVHDTHIHDMREQNKTEQK
ncbi:MAG: hypothetical protein ABIP50_03745 [Candidatus Saccharimonadales bacterium]